MTHAKRRILLAEFHPLKPSIPIYATWNPLDKHADVALSGGNLTATKATLHQTNWACVRATIPLRVDQWYWETVYIFTGAADCVAGIAGQAGLLDWRPGSIGSAGGPDRNGQPSFDGSLYPPIGAVSSGDVICHWLDLDGYAYRVRINGGAWSTVVSGRLNLLSLMGAGGMYAFAGFKRPIGSSVSITANFGAPQ